MGVIVLLIFYGVLYGLYRLVDVCLCDAWGFIVLLIFDCVLQFFRVIDI